ncbi:NUDIX hydrolase [Streptomyces umbrinus]|uniref:NUDIX hydrolase n=1 Tax=Streptomyces umbrinus TaxID=67370 RepID=UPI003407E638
MTQRSILIKDDEVAGELGFVLICSGYLVERGKVLLVHHKGFDKWVPPGGHLETEETFSAAAVREFKEETGLQVKALSAQPDIHQQDAMARPEPSPFYVDVEYDFPIPAIVQFYYVKRIDDGPIQAQLSEVKDVCWFSFAELDRLATFEQVRSLARHALRNYPISAERTSMHLENGLTV